MTLSDAEKDRVVELAQDLVRHANDAGLASWRFTKFLDDIRAALDPPPLPCPFCGCPPKVLVDGGVECGDIGHTAHASSIDNWNWRAAP